MKQWHFAENSARRQGRDGELYPADAEDFAIDGAGLQAEKKRPKQTLERTGPRASQEAESEASEGKEKLLVRQLDRWIASMERLGLADYVRYLDNRKRMLWSNFWGGVARGVGTAVGFTILGAILVIILQNLAKRNLPLIGDALAQIVTIVQMQMK